MSVWHRWDFGDGPTGLCILVVVAVFNSNLGRIDEGPESTSVYTGDTAIFKCVVTAVPGAVIRWQKNRVNLDLATNVDERYTELESGTLEIKNVKMSDEADYRCRATNIEGMRRSEEASLSIIFSGSMVRRPEFASRPQNAEVLEGGDVVLECAVNANPRPTVTWWKDGQPITPRRVFFRKILSFSFLYKMKHRKVSSITPRYEKEPTSLFAEVNSDINFECKVYGVPFPTIEWIKNGDTITPSDYFKIVEGTNLKILGLVKSDEGLYQCKASNDIGNIQTSAQLIIVDRGSTVQLEYLTCIPSISLWALDWRHGCCLRLVAMETEVLSVVIFDLMY
uniref:Netrin receptor DCC-like n=1 Tax=Saccoglossus kowalevskii TaxID=10224 RepID=A0ABM0LX57_SACKO|nr:PREDICTED: netrin receptor DCC-like [Saccoglossus kowalevskii]